MVRIASSFVFLLSVVTIGIATPSKRTVPQVQADIAVISAKVTTLDNSIKAFPLTGGSLSAALGVHTGATAILVPLQTATTDVIANGPVNDADGAAILTSVEAFAPTIQDALTGIVTKKPAFVALPVGGLPALILIDLKNLKGNTTAFANALIANAPASLVAEATTLRDGILAGFDTAITAYTP